jgi:hypothetical protein
VICRRAAGVGVGSAGVGVPPFIIYPRIPFFIREFFFFPAENVRTMIKSLLFPKENRRRNRGADGEKIRTIDYVELRFVDKKIFEDTI